MKLKNGMMFLALSASLTMSAATPKTGANRENLDESVSPRVDFYQYACGGWQKNNPLGDEYSRFGSFDMLGENNKKQLHELVEGLRSTKHPYGSVAQKIGDLYAMGMDSVRLNKEGASTIQADLARIQNAKPEEYSALLSWLHTFSSPFFGVGVSSDFKDSNTNILYWAQSGLGLGDRDYYLQDDEQTVAIRNAYKVFIQDLCKLAGYNAADAERVMKNVMNIETELAKVAMSRTEQRNLAAQYNIRSMEQIDSVCPAVNWDVYLKGLYLEGVDKMCVMQPASLAKVNELYLLLVQKIPLHFDGQINVTENNSVNLISNPGATLEVGKEILITFYREQDVSFCGISVHLYFVNILKHAIIKKIIDEGEQTRLIYGETDSNPMQLFFTAFLSEQEAAEEHANAKDKEAEYTKARTAADYFHMIADSFNP